MLTVQRGLVPVCLTLSATFALPLLAAPPSQSSVAASGAQTIVLQHVVPSDIVKMMHWDVSSSLPVGVTQIVSVPLQNALLVKATPAGLAKVREIVKLLDIEQRQAQIKSAIASVSDTDLKASGIEFDLVPLTAADLKQGFLQKQGFIQYASGSGAAQFLQTLGRKQAVTEGPDITTTNNVEASMIFSAAGLPANAQQFRVIPRINADNSITLDLHAAFPKGTEKREVSTLRTLKSGDTMLLVMPAAFPGDEDLLLFVTATVK